MCNIAEHFSFRMVSNGRFYQRVACDFRRFRLRDFEGQQYLRSRVEPASGGAKTLSVVRVGKAAACGWPESRKPQLRSCSCEALGGSSKVVLAVQFKAILIL